MTYYKLNFALVQHHNWSGEFLDSLYPFERDIYMGLLNAFLEKQENDRQSPQFG